MASHFPLLLPLYLPLTRNRFVPLLSSHHISYIYLFVRLLLMLFLWALFCLWRQRQQQIKWYYWKITTQQKDAYCVLWEASPWNAEFEKRQTNWNNMKERIQLVIECEISLFRYFYQSIRRMRSFLHFILLPLRASRCDDNKKTNRRPTSTNRSTRTGSMVIGLVVACDRFAVSAGANVIFDFCHSNFMSSDLFFFLVFLQRNYFTMQFDQLNLRYLLPKTEKENIQIENILIWRQSSWVLHYHMPAGNLYFQCHQMKQLNQFRKHFF